MSFQTAGMAGMRPISLFGRERVLHLDGKRLQARRLGRHSNSDVARAHSFEQHHAQERDLDIRSLVRAP